MPESLLDTAAKKQREQVSDLPRKTHSTQFQLRMGNRGISGVPSRGLEMRMRVLSDLGDSACVSSQLQSPTPNGRAKLRVKHRKGRGLMWLCWEEG